MCGLNAQTLPRENKNNVFERMRAERERQAKEYRAEGEEEALKIRAEADLEVARLKSEALQKIAVDSRRRRCRSIAYPMPMPLNKTPVFFQFWRTLEAYEKTLGEGTTVVMPPTSDFFKYLTQKRPR